MSEQPNQDALDGEHQCNDPVNWEALHANSETLKLNRSKDHEQETV